MPAEKRVAIVQSNYVPWRGYFDLIASVDEFILLDDAQYTRRDWRNRNRIKTPQGARWLTIAVEVSGRYTQAIHETLVAEPDWAERHWAVLRQNYARAAGFGETGDFLAELYATVPGPSLTAVNRHFLDGIAARLGIETPITLSLDYDPHGQKTERLLDLCVKAGASEYVSGPAARAYLEEERFRERGIDLSWFEYGPYPEYDQPHPPFDPQVSIVDLLLSAGDGARALLRPDTRVTR
jgi:hypothetical protein